MSMTIKNLKEIISNLPDDTRLLIEENDISDVKAIVVQYHSDGRMYLIFTALE